MRIAEIARRNHEDLYKYIEADLLRWFAEDYGSLPWLNRQFERGKEGHYEYAPEAERDLRKLIGVGAGNRFVWAIKPTKNNAFHEAFSKGSEDEAA